MQNIDFFFGPLSEQVRNSYTFAKKLIVAKFDKILVDVDANFQTGEYETWAQLMMNAVEIMENLAGLDINLDEVKVYHMQFELVKSFEKLV